MHQIDWEKAARVVEEQTGIDQDVTRPVVLQSEPKTIERYFGFLTKIKTFTASPDRLIIVVLTMDILFASVPETKAEWRLIQSSHVKRGRVGLQFLI